MADVSRPAWLLRHGHRRETDGADDLLARHSGGISDVLESAQRRFRENGIWRHEGCRELDRLLDLSQLEQRTNGDVERARLSRIDPLAVAVEPIVRKREPPIVDS